MTLLNIWTKWEPTDRYGVNPGHYLFHAVSVELVLNIRTGYVSPQYHVVFDDNFSIVYHTRKGTLPGNWNNLVEEQSELDTQENFTIEK